MTDALVTWLSRALDHAEEVARAAQTTSGRRYWRSGVWEVDPGDATAGDCVYDVNTDGGPGEAATTQEAAHIALHDPRAVLARVEAERAVLREHSGIMDGFRWDLAARGDVCERCAESDRDGDRDDVSYPCQTVRLLAYGHRFDIEGWRDEWAPEGVGVGA